MGSYCPVCDQFVENLDVCSHGEYHRDDYEQTFDEKLISDEIWYQGEVRTRSKSKKHREEIIYGETNKLISMMGKTSETHEKIYLFEKFLVIFKNNKWILENNKKLAEAISHKINVFSNHSQEFRHLKSFRYQLFGEC